MSSVPQDRRYAPPQAEVADVVARDTLELAERGTRFGAAIIDILVAMAATWAITLLTPWSPFSGIASRGLMMTALLNTVVGYLIFLVVQGYLLATRGQTIGKMMVSIRIVRSSGERASFPRLVGLRYGVLTLANLIPVAGPLFGVVDALLIFRESRKCLHDNIADTIVVKA